MLLRNSVITSLFLVCALATRASACMYQVDEVKQKNDLITQVLSAAHLDLTKDMKRISSINVQDFKFWESISTPMCPDEMTYQGKVVIYFVAPDKRTECMIRSVVTKIETWNRDGSPSPISFEFENGVPETTCLTFPAVASAGSEVGTM